MKIAIAQIDLAVDQRMKNKNKIISYVRTAVMKNKPDVIVLPEMWSTSFYPSDTEKYADVEGGETKKFLGGLAKEHGINIVGGSVVNQSENKLYNTSYSFDRKGELMHTYSKVHLYTPAKEQTIFTSGQDLGIFELDGVKAGVAIGYDLEFPEWIRTMALAGIKILFIPAAWTHPRLFAWETLLSARAIENQMFVVGANSTGTTKDMNFCGHSSIIDPSGRILSSGREEEMLIWGEIDLNTLKQIRHNIPIYADRRPTLYEK
ncbi:carbon-nitrogen family hydrolase [Alkalibacterium kapii]|uniref:Hydrolase n=1 Tax=Alkalibacterium kapii TaxID=426704 RepID=A0A511AY52_9LACT|nr:carbon-nitrogen family hydrolase [Alkalibacterium kapii]GEK90537.1 hydrolase [Alkalibacterium kapii]